MFSLSRFLLQSHWAVVVCGSLLTIFAALASRKVNKVLFPLYMIFIVYMTVMAREIGIKSVKFDLFWSYRLSLDNVVLRMEILNNIWLFVPLGAILYRLYPKWNVVLLLIVISVAIEISQYVLGVGFSELDDVIHNGVGGVIGVAVCAGVRKWWRGCDCRSCNS